MTRPGMCWTQGSPWRPCRSNHWSRTQQCKWFWEYLDSILCDSTALQTALVTIQGGGYYLQRPIWHRFCLSEGPHLYNSFCLSVLIIKRWSHQSNIVRTQKMCLLYIITVSPLWNGITSEIDILCTHVCVCVRAHTNTALERKLIIFHQLLFDV